MSLKNALFIQKTAASPISAAQYLAGGGPLTLPGGAAGLAFSRTRFASRDHSATRPDIELVMGAGSLAGDMLGILRTLLGKFELALFPLSFGEFSLSGPLVSMALLYLTSWN